MLFNIRNKSIVSGKGADELELRYHRLWWHIEGRYRASRFLRKLRSFNAVAGMIGLQKRKRRINWFSGLPFLGDMPKSVLRTVPRRGQLTRRGNLIYLMNSSPLSNMDGDFSFRLLHEPFRRTRYKEKVLDQHAAQCLDLQLE